MDEREADALLHEHLERLRRRSFADLQTLVGSNEVLQVRGASGVTYTVDLLILWDGEPGGDIRVLGSIDDGGWRAFAPRTGDFIMAPDGTFVGE